jgi:hypothetical protein
LTFLETYGSALVLVLTSILVGRAICTLCGGPQQWAAAPAVGLSALIVLAGAAVKLPGQAASAALVCFIAALAAWGYVMARRLVGVRPGDIAIGGASLLAASLPFLASGRVGLPAGLDNDMAVHLLWAEALRSSRMAHLWGVVNGSPLPPYNGYPLGPHSVVAALGNATGMRLDLVFTGLLAAIPVLTALIAADVLPDLAWWRRAVVALMCGFCYLPVAFYGEGAFKETLMAVLLLAFVLHLEQVQRQWSTASTAMRWRLLTPAAVLVAAGVYNYSYLGVSWFAGTLAVWALGAAVLRPRLAMAWLSRRRIAAAAPWLAGTAGFTVLLLLPEAGQALSFFRSYGVSPAAGALAKNNLGNLFHPLSFSEGLGIWISRDFRLDPTNAFRAGQLSVLALGVFLVGLIWSLRRRQLLLPAAAVASIFIWWYSNRTQSPYVAAKALVIASPVFMALGLRALLAREPRRTPWRALRLLVMAVFCVVAAYSSFLVLRNEPVMSPEPARELAGFEHTIGDSPVLFLGVDDFAPWQLRQAPVTTLSTPTFTEGAVSARANKPYTGGDALDFDSADPSELDNVRYVVTSNTSYASQAPPNFRLLARDQLYELWQRTGPTPFRQVIEGAASPGAILDCRTSKLGSARGEASVMAQPLVLPGFTLAPGASTVVSFGVPQGQWEVSIQYFSDVGLQLSVNGQRWTMPAYVGRLGPFFRVGVVTGRGITSQLKLRVKAIRPSFLTGSNLTADITGVAAVRLPSTHRLVPLRQACGQYIDWYTLS